MIRSLVVHNNTSLVDRAWDRWMSALRDAEHADVRVRDVAKTNAKKRLTQAKTMRREAWDESARLEDEMWNTARVLGDLGVGYLTVKMTEYRAVRTAPARATEDAS